VEEEVLVIYLLSQKRKIANLCLLVFALSWIMKLFSVRIPSTSII
jgi:hypothetical protein